MNMLIVGAVLAEQSLGGSYALSGDRETLSKPIYPQISFSIEDI